MITLVAHGFGHFQDVSILERFDPSTSLNFFVAFIIFFQIEYLVHKGNRESTKGYSR